MQVFILTSPNTPFVFYDQKLAITLVKVHVEDTNPIDIKLVTPADYHLFKTYCLGCIPEKELFTRMSIHAVDQPMRYSTDRIQVQLLAEQLHCSPVNIPLHECALDEQVQNDKVSDATIDMDKATLISKLNRYSYLVNCRQSADQKKEVVCYCRTCMPRNVDEEEKRRELAKSLDLSKAWIRFITIADYHKFMNQLEPSRTWSMHLDLPYAPWACGFMRKFRQLENLQKMKQDVQDKMLDVLNGVTKVAETEDIEKEGIHSSVTSDEADWLMSSMGSTAFSRSLDKLMRCKGITGHTDRLTKIERMMASFLDEAERFREEDKKQQDGIGAKNKLEQYAYDLKSTINDEKSKDKISLEDRATIEKYINETTKWVESNENAGAEEFKHKQKELESAYQSIIMKGGTKEAVEPINESNKIALQDTTATLSTSTADVKIPVQSAAVQSMVQVPTIMEPTATTTSSDDTCTTHSTARGAVDASYCLVQSVVQVPTAVVPTTTSGDNANYCLIQ